MLTTPVSCRGNSTGAAIWCKGPKNSADSKLTWPLLSEASFKSKSLAKSGSLNNYINICIWKITKLQCKITCRIYACRPSTKTWRFRQHATFYRSAHLTSQYLFVQQNSIIASIAQSQNKQKATRTNLTDAFSTEASLKFKSSLSLKSKAKLATKRFADFASSSTNQY